MAGVAGPMLRRSRSQGTRFLLGLLVGGLLASSLLAAALWGAGTLIDATVPDRVRLVAAAVIIAGLGLLDVGNRTPHVWRQVPQRFVRRFAPGRLGAIWGFDLYLLFTTQKTTSLIWAGLVGLVLVDPSASWVTLITITTLSVVAVVGRSVWFATRGPSAANDTVQRWFRPMRRLFGLGLVLVAVVVAVGRWSG